MILVRKHCKRLLFSEDLPAKLNNVQLKGENCAARTLIGNITEEGIIELHHCWIYRIESKARALREKHKFLTPPYFYLCKRNETFEHEEEELESYNIHLLTTELEKLFWLKYYDINR